MKVGILTFHRVCNYGAVLQAHALTQAFCAAGADSELIDYENAVLKGQYGLVNRDNFHHPRLLLRDILSISKTRRRNRLFRIFRERHLSLGKQHYTQCTPPDGKDYDLVVTGSDQVWSMACNGNDTHYFLDTIDSAVHCGSYAACMAKALLTEEEQTLYRRLLTRFDYISVREEMAQQLLQPLTEKSVVLSPDPTLLLPTEYWTAFAKKPTETDYIFVFMLSYSKEMLQRAYELSQKMGCKLVTLNMDSGICPDKYGPIAPVSPEEWLGYIQGARYVVTNSFHATAFAAIFQRNFTVCTNKNAGRNTRLIQLLRSLRLEQCLSAPDEPIVPGKVDYTLSTQAVEQFRGEGMAYINAMLSNASQA